MKTAPSSSSNGHNSKARDFVSIFIKCVLFYDVVTNMTTIIRFFMELDHKESDVLLTII